MHGKQKLTRCMLDISKPAEMSQHGLYCCARTALMLLECKQIEQDKLVVLARVGDGRPAYRASATLLALLPSRQ